MYIIRTIYTIQHNRKIVMDTYAKDWDTKKSTVTM